jgi:ATP-dependent Clp protease adaptor protein ClpS
MSQFEFDDDVITESEEKIQVPRKYKVLLLNDDYTPMEFVVFILEQVFHKTPAQANALMLAVHQTGRGVCGVYSREIAETKVAITSQISEENEYPLRCIMEEE